MQRPLIIDRLSFIIGTGIAAALALLLAQMSSGMSLIVATLPGLALSWIVFGVFYVRQTDLSETSRILPLYFIAMAMQFLHFGEEYVTGYATEFPALYGGAAYSLDMFVLVNMAACAIFVITCLSAFLWGVTSLLVPVFFFAINVTFGNAVSQTWLALLSDGYFPGLITGMAFWVLGPLLIITLVGSLRGAVTLMVVLACALIFFLTRYMVIPGA